MVLYNPFYYLPKHTDIFQTTEDYVYNTTMIFKNITKDDEGKYTCSAATFDNTTNVHMSLTILGKVPAFL